MEEQILLKDFTSFSGKGLLNFWFMLASCKTLGRITTLLFYLFGEKYGLRGFIWVPSWQRVDLWELNLSMWLGQSTSRLSISGCVCEGISRWDYHLKWWTPKVSRPSPCTGHHPILWWPPQKVKEGRTSSLPAYMPD